MFCTRDAKIFVPHGRLCSQEHPASSTFEDGHASTSASRFGLYNFKDISLNARVHENWHVRRIPSSIVSTDEELYFKDNLVVWSKGIAFSTSQTIKCFTMDSPVIEALWCTFLVPLDKKPSFPEEDMPACELSSIGVIEDGRMSFFCDDGQSYTSHIPMPVKKVWAIKNGLLFERSTTMDSLEAKVALKQESNKMQKLTTLFSLTHPLDELVPVVCKTGVANQALASFVIDAQQEIVFTSVEPSLAVTFHHDTKKHSVWGVRWASFEEVEFLTGRSMGDHTSSASPNTSRAFDSHRATPRPVNSSSSFSRYTLSPSMDVSHGPSYGSRISSPSFTHSHHSSPAYSRVAALNRTFSPSSRFGSPGRPFNFSARRASECPSFFRASVADPNEPLSPEICLAHMWTEPIISREGEPASKVFFTCDFSGQQFLCLLVSSKQQMKCIKFEENLETNVFSFGNSSTISAKDAIPLSTLQLMVLLDLNNVLYLYSGLYKMNAINVSGLTTTNHFSQSFATSDLGPVTSSRPTSSMDVRPDDVPVSPVAHEMPHDGQPFLNLHHLPIINTFNVCFLKDHVENRFTIELLEGELCRVEMPKISSNSFVSRCLNVLKNCLPEHIVMMFISKWYLARNTPGVAGNLDEWTQFSGFILASLGYSTDNEVQSSNMSPKSKKRRMSSEGTLGDFNEWLVSFDIEKFEISMSLPPGSFSKTWKDKANLMPPVVAKVEPPPDPISFLYPFIFHVFFNLHLLYEEVKLNTMLRMKMEDLGKLLCRLSLDTNLPLYTDLYCRDLPSLHQYCYTRLPNNFFADVRPPQYFTQHPPHILEWIYLFLAHHDVAPFPILPGITTRIQLLITIYVLKFIKEEIDITKYMKCIFPSFDMPLVYPSLMGVDKDHSILLLSVEVGAMRSHMSPCLLLPIIDSIHACMKNPPKHWTEEAYNLIGREDLAKQCRFEKYQDRINPKDVKSFLNQDPTNKTECDGMDQLQSELLRLRFKKDLRVNEIKNLLQSSVPTKVSLQQKPGVSDHEFIDEQEKYLYAVSARTMALPVGRGMLTYSTYVAVPTEALPIPKLCLSGKVPPRNNIIEMTHIELPPNLTDWSQFHNGVAAGLRLTDSTRIDSTWILFNKMKSENMANEHAGFLMGQGLTGHLSGLASLDVHDYLIKGNEMISIGLLLGMSADKRGTMDMTATKTLSIHIAALLPPSSAELDVSHNIQVACVLGIGLVYQSSAHRHMSEVLLAEIGRPPGPEMENSTDRESYSLAAGFALGNVMLAKGTELLDVSGSEMPDNLYYYMNGSKRKPLSNTYRERYKTTSCQIKEGECVNIDVTAPGAIVALGLMFFDSGNTSVAEWLVAPDTPSLLECMKPDLLMLRAIGYGLIMWQSVVPTDEWIDSNIPEIVKQYAFDQCEMSDNPDCNIDVELMSQAYVNIIAGCCMVIGLKYAGSANKNAFECLHRNFNQIYRWQRTTTCIECAGKYTLEQCLCVLVLSMAMVMAGTGDLTVLRICRHLRARIAPHVYYGNHMAIGMACGLLILGGGKCTLSTKPEAIAALLCAFFPKFPISATDNKFHLQAFRHLYVLAIEKRILIPCDVETNKLCYADIQLVYQDGRTETVGAPCLLPELDSLSEIRVVGSNYWQVEFKKEENWEALKQILAGGGHLYVKQKANFIHLDKKVPGASDEGGEFLDRIFSHKNLSPLTKDSSELKISDFFVGSKDITMEQIRRFVFGGLYVTMPDALPVQIKVHQDIIDCLEEDRRPFLMWQFKITSAYYGRVECWKEGTFSLVSKEFMINMQDYAERKHRKRLGRQRIKSIMKAYLTNKRMDMTSGECACLSSLLTWYCIPHPKILFADHPKSHSFPSLYCVLKKRGFPVASIKALSRCLSSDM